jgi:hypothetical protein
VGVERSGKVVVGSDRKVVVVVVMVVTERLEGADGVRNERGEDWPCICFFPTGRAINTGLVIQCTNIATSKSQDRT